MSVKGSRKLLIRNAFVFTFSCFCSPAKNRELHEKPISPVLHIHSQDQPLVCVPLRLHCCYCYSWWPFRHIWRVQARGQRRASETENAGQRRRHQYAFIRGIDCRCKSIGKQKRNRNWNSAQIKQNANKNRKRSRKKTETQWKCLVLWGFEDFAGRCHGGYGMSTEFYKPRFITHMGLLCAMLSSCRCTHLSWYPTRFLLPFFGLYNNELPTGYYEGYTG